MNIKNWKRVIGAVAIFAIFAVMLVPYLSNTQNELYVNGKKSSEAPYVTKGQVYVPLSIAVKGMGDTILIDKNVTSAAVVQGKKEIVFTLNSLNVLVNGKNENLHVKETKWATAPTGFDVKKKGNHLFVPVETLSQVLGYEVSSKKDGSRYIVQVGTQTDKPTDGDSNNGSKPDGGENPFVPDRWKESPTGLYQDIMKQYPLPEGIKPFKAKTKEFGSTPATNFKILGDELGFTGVSKTSAEFVPYGVGSTFFLNYDSEGFYYLKIESWYATNDETQIVNLTPYAVKSVFNLFFGETEGNKFFTKFDKGMNGDTAINQYVNKINTINKRQLEITDYGTSIVLRIGDKGKDFTKTGW